MRRYQGYTLIELMIAMGLGLVITAAVVTAYVSSKSNTERTTDVSNMQEVARTALSILREDISMAGFFGHMQYELYTDPTAGGNILNTYTGKGDNTQPRIILPDNDSSTSQCLTKGWALGDNDILNNGPLPKPSKLPFIWFYAYEIGDTDGSVGDVTPLNEGCYGTNAATGSDIIQIKRVLANEHKFVTEKNQFEGITAPKSGDSKKLYLITEPLTAGFATQKQLTSGTRPFATEQVNQPSAWEYINRVYYVRNDSDPNDSSRRIPVLVRRSLQVDSSTLKTLSVSMGAEEEVIQGVESIHIELGFDTSKSDERVDRYMNIADIGDEFMNNHPKVVVGLHILIRDLQPTPGYGELAGTRNYRLGNGKTLTFDKSDNYKRQLISSNVLLYNGISASWVEGSITGS